MQSIEVPSLNDIFPKCINVKYLSVIDARSGYHNLRLDEEPSYLPAFTCQFGRYKQLLFQTALAGSMFQKKIDKILRGVKCVWNC